MNPREVYDNLDQIESLLPTEADYWTLDRLINPIYKAHPYLPETTQKKTIKRLEEMAEAYPTHIFQPSLKRIRDVIHGFVAQSEVDKASQVSAE